MALLVIGIAATNGSFSANNTPTERKTASQASIRQIGLNDADSSVLVAASEDYRMRIANLSAQASQVLMRYHPTHSPLTAQDKNQLDELDRDRNFVTNG